MNFYQPTRKVRPNANDTPGEQSPSIILGPDSPISCRNAATLLAEDFAKGAHFGLGLFVPVGDDKQ
jgi:hypothetical protein